MSQLLSRLPTHGEERNGTEYPSELVRFNGTSTQFRSLAPSLTRKAGTENPTVKQSRRYINLANAI